MTDSAFLTDDAAPPFVQAQLRRALFTACAMFILLGPAPGQLFGNHSAWLREWIMYSGVGIGIPKGMFTVQGGADDGAVYTPLQAAGLERYPRIAHYSFEQRIFDPSGLARFAAPLCASLSDDQRLAFSGHVGTRQGWEPLADPDVCQADGARS